MSARLLTLFAILVIASVTYAIQPDPIYRETIIRHNFHGKITVWIKPEGNETKTYTVQKTHSIWKIVDEDVAIFD